MDKLNATEHVELQNEPDQVGETEQIKGSEQVQESEKVEENVNELNNDNNDNNELNKVHKEDHNEAHNAVKKDNEADKAGSDSQTLEEKILVLESELEVLKQKNADYYERLQRQQAEFDNYRKRTLKEKNELIKYASEQIVLSLLPVVDNFERAIAASKSNPDFKSYAQGVEMIFRQIMTVLEKEGLKPIEALGRPFDPNLHEAVMQVESEEHEENTIVEELQKGYFLKDKVIRPSMVKVAR